MLAAAVEEVILAKQREGMSRQHVAGLRCILRSFSRSHPDASLRALSPDVIEAWLDARGGAPSSRASNLGRLGSLFAYSVRRGYIAENPIRRIKPPRLRLPPPRILTPTEAAQMLRKTRAECIELLPWVVLGMFAGIRPQEILDLTWDSIEGDKVRMTRTKTGRRRMAHLEPCAVAWINVCDRSIPLCRSWSTVRRRRKELFGRWTSDVLRHTAASYLLALHQDVGKVALWLGNSQRILLRHYHELVTAADCAAFWGLTP